MGMVSDMVAFTFGLVVGIFAGVFGVFGLLVMFIVVYEMASGLGDPRPPSPRDGWFGLRIVQGGFVVGTLLSLHRFYNDEFFALTLLFFAFALIIGVVVYGFRRIIASQSWRHLPGIK